MLIAELIAAACVLIRPVGALPVPDAPAASEAGTLVVGDGRTVRLHNPGGAGAEELLARVAANIGSAVDAVEAFWGTDWSHDIVVVATGSERQFDVEVGAVPDGWPTDIAAVAVSERVDPARRLAVGQRIVFAPGANTMSDSALRIVLGHELFHYAARADTALDAPRWLTEGVADFVGRPSERRPEATTASPRWPAVLPSDAELDAPGPQRSLAYDRAWGFARFVADAYGPAQLRELYLRACGTGHVDPATAVRDVLGIGLPELLARWQQWPTR